jgi:hypothetical protein
LGETEVTFAGNCELEPPNHRVIFFATEVTVAKKAAKKAPVKKAAKKAKKAAKK